MRMGELDSGSIKIDDLDISKLGLIDLRSAIAVIPQDPALFKGTIRYNLDPFDKYVIHSQPVPFFVVFQALFHSLLI